MTMKKYNFTFENKQAAKKFYTAYDGKHNKNISLSDCMVSVNLAYDATEVYTSTEREKYQIIGIA